MGSRPCPGHPDSEVREGDEPAVGYEGQLCDIGGIQLFVHSWREYKELANVTTAVKKHLVKCLGEEVSTLLYGKFGTEGVKSSYAASATENDVKLHLPLYQGYLETGGLYYPYYPFA